MLGTHRLVCSGMEWNDRFSKEGNEPCGKVMMMCSGVFCLGSEGRRGEGLKCTCM